MNAKQGIITTQKRKCPNHPDLGKITGVKIHCPVFALAFGPGLLLYHWIAGRIAGATGRFARVQRVVLTLN